MRDAAMEMIYEPPPHLWSDDSREFARGMRHRWVSRTRIIGPLASDKHGMHRVVNEIKTDLFMKDKAES